MKKRLAFSFIMGTIATCIISFTLVGVNVGFNDLFFTVWLRSWLIAFCVAIPLLLFVAPQVQKMVSRWLD